MNAENFISDDLSTAKGKRNAALILAGSMVFSGIMISAVRSEQQRTNDLMKQRVAEWTKERVERVLTYIP